MKYMRRQFQIGPTTHCIEETPEGWVVYAVWWEISGRLEKVQLNEAASEPLPEAEARAKQAELEEEVRQAEDRRRARARAIACA